MIRQIAAIFLLFAFAAQLFNRAAIIVDYYANTASFAKYCENKARPVMHCNGKCQMMKKLNAAEKKDQQHPSRKSNYNEELVYCCPPFGNPIVHSYCIVNTFPASFDASIAKGVYTGIFHPPSMV